MEIKLRKYNMKDLKRVCGLFINENVLKNLDSRFKAKDIKIKDEKKWLKEVIENYKKKKPSSFTLAILYNKEYVGSIGINKFNYKNNNAEIGYWIGEPYWGKGITTKALKQFSRIVFNKFKLKRLEAFTYLRNKPSQRVLQKAGFKHEGTRKNAIKKGTKYLDDTIYALTR